MPSAVVLVPADEPFIITVTPTSGSEVPLSVTLPLMEMVWAEMSAVMQAIRHDTINAVSLHAVLMLKY